MYNQSSVEAQPSYMHTGFDHKRATTVQVCLFVSTQLLHRNVHMLCGDWDYLSTISNTASSQDRHLLASLLQCILNFWDKAER